MTFPKTFDERLQAVLDAFAEDPHDPYWARRVLEEYWSDAKIARHRAEIAQAVATWASYDPAWFVHAIGLTMETHCFEWPKDLLVEIGNAQGT